MKAFFIIFILIIGVLGGGTYYCYTQGHLDKYFNKEEAVADGPAASDSTKVSPTSTSTPKTTSAPKPVATTTTPKPSKPAPKPSAPKTEFEKKAEEKYPMPNFKPLLEIVDNWNSVPQRAFPKAITVNVDADYKIQASDGKVLGSSKAPAGHKAVPLKHKPGMLQITDRPGGNALAVVKVEDTDFKEQIEKLYDTLVADAQERILKARRVYAKVLAAQPAGGGGGSSGDDPRFAPVRAYLAAGKMESALLEEAKEWYWMGSEVHDGRSYDVVLVNFEVNTIFGLFPNSMKCLLSNGQVVKWIDSETGEERT